MILAISPDAARPALELLNNQVSKTRCAIIAMSGMLARHPRPPVNHSNTQQTSMFRGSPPLPGRLERDVQSNVASRVYQESVKNEMEPGLPKQPLDSKGRHSCNILNWSAGNLDPTAVTKSPPDSCPAQVVKIIRYLIPYKYKNRELDTPSTRLLDKMPGVLMAWLITSTFEVFRYATQIRQ